MKKVLLAAVLMAIVFTGCQTDSQVASKNLSKAAEMFEIERRIVFYNGINGEYILTILGRCSIESNGMRIGVTCKTGPSSFKKLYLGLSENVTYFAEQLSSKDVSVYRYRVIFKPSVIIPDIDLKLGM